MPKEASLPDITRGRIIDDDDRDLAKHLFAAATAMLEDATEVAIAGQSRRTTPSGLAENARLLRASALEIATLAEAAESIVKRSPGGLGNRRDSP